MANYEETMQLLHGSFRYEFDDTQLMLTGYYDGKETTLDFDGMTEDMFEELCCDDVPYKDAMRILRGSKEYNIEDSKLKVTDYHTGNAVTFDLGCMSEEIFEELRCEEDLDDEYDFEDAVSALDVMSEAESL